MRAMMACSRGLMPNLAILSPLQVDLTHPNLTNILVSFFLAIIKVPGALQRKEVNLTHNIQSLRSGHLLPAN